MAATDLSVGHGRYGQMGNGTGRNHQQPYGITAINIDIMHKKTDRRSFGITFLNGRFSHWSTASRKNCSCRTRIWNDKPVHRREFPERLHDECGLGIMHGVQPTSGIRETVQDSQGDFCNKLKLPAMRKITLSEYNSIPKDYRGIWTVERWDLPNWAEIRENTWESAP